MPLPSPPSRRQLSPSTIFLLVALPLLAHAFTPLPFLARFPRPGQGSTPRATYQLSSLIVLSPRRSGFRIGTASDPSSSAVSSNSSNDSSSPPLFGRLHTFLSTVKVLCPLFRIRGGSSSSSSTSPSRPSTIAVPPSPPSSPVPSFKTRTLNWAAFAGPTSSPTRLRKRDLALGAVLSAFATAAAVAVPLGYGGVVNVLLMPTETPLGERKLALRKALQLLALIYTSEPLLTWVYIRHMTGLFSKGVMNLKDAVFTKLLEQEVEFFDKAGPGEITSYLSQDISGLKDILYGNLQRDRGLRAILEAIVGTVLLFKLQPRLGLLFSLVIPSVATITAQLGRRLTKTILKEGRALAAENGCAMEVVRNIREVKSFAAEAKETARYRYRLSNTRSLSSEAGRNRGIMESCSRFAIYFSIFTVSTLGGFLVQKGEMGAAALVAFIGYCFSLNFAIQGINYSWADLKRGTTLLDHVMSVLETHPTRLSLPSSLSSPSGNQEGPLTISGHVEFKDVVFAYPNRADVPVLRGVSLTLRPGTLTAVVGPSGAGKTTLTQILSQFYAPSKGDILIDGQPLQSLPPSLLNKEIALVGQSPNLFSGSIAYNIAYGEQSKRTEADIQDDAELMVSIYEAARRANALDFICAFPDGMTTIIGEGGVQLSGGQRQRLAIARAILKDSKILVLDEATSALDALSAKLVQEALENLMAGRTTLVIAHRLDTVIKADNIIVLKKGKVVEEGKHADLMAPSAAGHYRTLMATQQTAYLND